MALFEINETTQLATNDKYLQTKETFASVLETRKPEFVDSGLDTNNRDSRNESVFDGKNSNSILSDSTNFYKHNGNFMENSGYFIIPRSIYFDPRFQAAPLKYQKVLITLLAHFAFAPTTHSIGAELIEIKIGQFCVTERKLVELCNEGTKFKKDLIDKNIVHRAVHFFCECHFLNQELIHDKNLLTIKVPEFYERLKKQSEPESEPEVNQKRTSKEEYKVDIGNISHITMSNSPAHPTKVKDKIFFNWEKKQLEGIEDSDLKDWSLAFPHVNVPEYLKFIEMDIGNKPTKYSRRKRISQTVLIYFKNQNENQAAYKSRAQNRPNYPRYSPKPQPKYNFDDSPSHPSKTISFAEEV